MAVRATGRPVALAPDQDAPFDAAPALALTRHVLSRNEPRNQWVAYRGGLLLQDGQSIKLLVDAAQALSDEDVAGALTVERVPNGAVGGTAPLGEPACVVKQTGGRPPAGARAAYRLERAIDLLHALSQPQMLPVGPVAFEMDERGCAAARMFSSRVSSGRAGRRTARSRFARFGL